MTLRTSEPPPVQNGRRRHEQATTARRPNLLDSWYKLTDEKTGTTYFWQAPAQAPAAPHKASRNGTSLQALRNGGSPPPTLRNGGQSAAKRSRSPFASPATDLYYRRSPLPSPSSGPPRSPPKTWKQRVTLTNGYSTRSAQPPAALIWSVDHVKPTVVLRKPRAPRLLRTLLCCFGAQPTQPLRPPAIEHASAPYSPKALEKLLLPPMRACDINKKCLIIDLDETLVHSSFKPVSNPDFVIPVEIDGVVHQVYVLKRPYVDEFLRRIGNLFECILFTASLAKYADPVADLLDKCGVFRSRLFREACVFHKGNYVKDLNRLGRDLKRVVIVDNSPASYTFHPDNAIPVQTWFDDMNDSELLDICPVLERLAAVDDVYSVLRNSNEPSPPPPQLPR